MDTNKGLQLPGQTEPITTFPNLRTELSEGNIGSIISEFLVVVFYIVGFLMFIWFVWGVFQYIFAGDNKDAVGQARKRMTWAIVGFILFLLALPISEYAQSLFRQNNNVTNIRPIENRPQATAGAGTGAGGNVE